MTRNAITTVGEDGKLALGLHFVREKVEVASGYRWFQLRSHSIHWACWKKSCVPRRQFTDFARTLGKLRRAVMTGVTAARFQRVIADGFQI